MKVAILGNSAASFVRPMAEGLQRMLSEIGVTAVVFYDGHSALNRVPPDFSEYVRNRAHGSLPRNALRYFIKDLPAFHAFVRRLRAFDVVVVVASIGGAFFTEFFCDATLRRFLPRTPIVLYDVFYLPTRGPWAKWLKEGNAEMGVPRGANWGLERYDWYLCSSVVSEIPMPAGPQPYSLIGLNLEDGTLRPDQKGEFTALIDFEAPKHLAERAVQISACEETGTKFNVLTGHYSMDEIRQIYRQTSIYFLAFRESFGLPICELQACGSYILTPYANWCPSHWLKDDLAQPGPGALSPNFVVYDNDKAKLEGEIRRLKATYNAQDVIRTFLQYHPLLLHGDLGELRKFVEMVEDGRIHNRSHLQHGGIKASEWSESAHEVIKA